MSAEKPPGLDGLIDLTERLTRMIGEQTRAFDRHRPQDAGAKMPELSKLANMYRAASMGIRAQPALAEAAPLAARRRLARATEAFHDALEAHAKALSASKTVTEGVVRSIADLIASKRASNVGYGPGAAKRAPATAITLNRRA